MMNSLGCCDECGKKIETSDGKCPLEDCPSHRRNLFLESTSTVTPHDFVSEQIEGIVDDAERDQTTFPHYGSAYVHPKAALADGHPL